MKRNFLDISIKIITWLKRRQRPRYRKTTVRVNIGSGLNVAQGWINIDASLNALFSSWPHLFLNILYNFSKSKNWYSRDEYINILKNNTFLHHDIRYGLPFENNVVEFMYASHILEHFHSYETERILTDAYRILKPGGWIRICVPDLEYAFELYNKGKRDEALELFFGASKTGFLDRHNYMYDYTLLRDILIKIGFSKVEHLSFKHGKIPNTQELDSRPEETLFVEAMK